MKTTDNAIYIPSTETLGAIDAIQSVIQANLDADFAHNGTAELTEICHGLATRSGWWTNLATGQTIDANTPHLISEKLCLIHSEVSEAMEGHRRNLMDDKLPHRKMIEVELADALIRIHDLAGFLGLDLAGAIMEKLAFNQQRADHKLENRTKEGGKSF